MSADREEAIALYEGRYISITLSDFRDLLELRKDQCRAEIAKLQPVVDMANLALRGLSNE